jgi:hypothetical protein
MTGTRFAKSETREFAERDRMAMPSSHAPSSPDMPEPWHSTNGAFIVALVAAGVLLAVLALALR